MTFIAWWILTENPAHSYVYYFTKEIDESQYLNVGYATHRGLLRQCPEYLLKTRHPLQYRSRKFLVSFTGNVEWFQFYRNVLWNHTKQHTLPADTFVHFYQKHSPLTEINRRIKGAEVLRSSDFVLNLSGDSPTTERIWDAFEHNTMPCAVSKEREALLRLMPFPHRVPWDELFLWIDADEFIKEPVQAMRNTILELSEREWERRYSLMLKHKRDVLWGYEDSVAVLNILEEAILSVKNLSVIKKDPF